MSMQYCQYPPASSVTSFPSGGITVITSPNTNGSTVNQAVTTTPVSFVPPTNAVGFILEADSINTDSVRWALGGAASTSAGMLTEQGRDSGYVPAATTISVAALSGTQNVVVTWVMSS